MPVLLEAFFGHVQPHDHDPEPEPEQADPVAAWFRAHFALLEAAGTLITQLDGAGPEVGVSPHSVPPLKQEQPFSLPKQPKRLRRKYVVKEDRCVWLHLILHLQVL